MAILTPAQLQTNNASTYTTNGVGSITGATARSFNVDFISSSITVSQTGSMSVATASYAATASLLLGSVASASLATTNLYTASVSNNIITFTKGDASTFNLTVATGSATTTFPFTGSAIISGSLKVTGSVFIADSLTVSDNITCNDGIFTGNIYATNTLKLYPDGNTGNGTTILYENTTIGQVGTNTLQVTGSTTLTGSLKVTGGFQVTGSANISSTLEASIIKAPAYLMVNTIYDNSGGTIILEPGAQTIAKTLFQVIGTSTVTGSLQVTGSSYGNVVAVTVASNTASIDLAAGNFFTATLSNSATTFFNFTNVRPGLTANLILTTGTVSTASFSSNVKQPSGSSYLPTSGSGRIDALSVAAVDTSNLYLVASKFFI